MARLLSFGNITYQCDRCTMEEITLNRDDFAPDTNDWYEPVEAKLWADARSQGWTTGFLNIHFCPRCSRELEEELFS